MELFLGYRPFDFVDEKTGRPVKGVTVYTADAGVDGVIGYVSSKVSMKTDEFNNVFGDSASVSALIGKQVNISYNKIGKPVSVAPLANK